MKTELDIGGLHLTGELHGTHVHVTVRGIGAPGSRPLLGTLTMAGLEWASLEALTDVTEHANRQRLADLAHINRLNAELEQERAKLQALRDSYMPVRSVVRDWDWPAIVEDGCHQADYEHAIERAAQALAHIAQAEMENGR